MINKLSTKLTDTQVVLSKPWGGGSVYFPSEITKTNYVEFLNLSDDNNSHQSFPWAPLKAARFTEKQNGLLRHSNVQSNTSDTATVPTSGTFK